MKPETLVIITALLTTLLIAAILASIAEGWPL